MADEWNPNEIRERKFGMSRRGYDRAEVRDFLGDIAERIADLETELAAVRARLSQLGITDLPDFKAEADQLGGEIQGILSAAMTAAEGLRNRAHADAEAIVTEARQAAMEARGDAWTSGSEMLGQADATTSAMLAEARDDALFIRAEAEQDAKRLVGDARRQADEMIRSSREDGEKLVVIAKAESEAILEGARQSAERAQERARALENRRAELLGELEEAESAIRDLEETRQRSTSEPAVGPRVTASDGRTHWPQDDGAIRILPATEPEEPTASTTVDAEEMAAEVAEMRSALTLPQQAETVAVLDAAAGEPEGDAAPEPEAGDEASDEAFDEVEIVDDVPGEVVEDEEPDEEEPDEEEPEPEPDHESVAAEDESVATEEDPGPESESHARDKITVVEDDPGIGALFAALRSEPDSESEPEPKPGPEPDPEVEVTETVAPAPPLHAVPDLAVGEGFELRDRTLLPIENTGLRGLKRRIVELQNRVLEDLRTSGGQYRLRLDLVSELMGDELDAVLQESYRAGHSAAAEVVEAEEPLLTGGPNQGAAEDFSGDLHAEVQDVIDRGAESGNRRLSSDVGRVFRSWRTDEAERHVRLAARRAYNDGLLAAYHRLGVPKVEYVAPGRPCGECSADSGLGWAPVEDAPPGVDVAPMSTRCGALVVPQGSDDSRRSSVE